MLGGHIYVIGGHDGGTPLSSMERYDPLTNEWAAQPSMNVGRDCVGVAIVNVSHGPGGGVVSQGSPSGVTGRSDSPVLHSNV